MHWAKRLILFRFSKNLWTTSGCKLLDDSKHLTISSNKQPFADDSWYNFSNTTRSVLYASSFRICDLFKISLINDKIFKFVFSWFLKKKTKNIFFSVHYSSLSNTYWFWIKTTKLGRNKCKSSLFALLIWASKICSEFILIFLFKLRHQSKVILFTFLFCFVLSIRGQTRRK